MDVSNYQGDRIQETYHYHRTRDALHRLRDLSGVTSQVIDAEKPVSVKTAACGRSDRDVS